MKRLLVLVLILTGFEILAQNDSTITNQSNSADKLLLSDEKLTIGGYAQIDYNQPLEKNVINNGELDVHRMVMLFGYKFNSKVQFITEIEYEHVKEVYVEQAFLNYKLNNKLNFKGGLIIIPMGLINQYHEPPYYNGVERPLIDGNISPTTWREIGAGISGNFQNISTKYQAYIVNGFKSYDGEGLLKGSSGFRSGRQKGAESIISSPNFTGRLDFYRINNLNIGLSAYYGKTQSDLYNGIDKNEADLIKTADSTIVGIIMSGADLTYNFKGAHLKAQMYYVQIDNSKEYNEFAGKDIGSHMLGYYSEIGYNVFKPFKKFNTELILFARYEWFDTHYAVTSEIAENDNYDRTMITTGLTWKMTDNAVLKSDIQFYKTASDNEYTPIMNFGLGVMF